MKILLLTVSLFAVSCMGIIQKKPYYIYESVEDDQWGVCVEACGDKGLAAVLPDPAVLTCSCEDLSVITIDLPTGATEE